MRPGEIPGPIAGLRPELRFMLAMSVLVQGVGFNFGLRGSTLNVSGFRVQDLGCGN